MNQLKKSLELYQEFHTLSLDRATCLAELPSEDREVVSRLHAEALALEERGIANTRRNHIRRAEAMIAPVEKWEEAQASDPILLEEKRKEILNRLKISDPLFEEIFERQRRRLREELMPGLDPLRELVCFFQRRKFPLSAGDKACLEYKPKSPVEKTKIPIFSTPLFDEQYSSRIVSWKRKEVYSIPLSLAKAYPSQGDVYRFFQEHHRSVGKSGEVIPLNPWDILNDAYVRCLEEPAVVRRYGGTPEEVTVRLASRIVALADGRRWISYFLRIECGKDYVEVPVEERLVILFHPDVHFKRLELLEEFMGTSLPMRIVRNFRDKKDPWDVVVPEGSELVSSTKRRIGTKLVHDLILRGKDGRLAAYRRYLYKDTTVRLPKEPDGFGGFREVEVFRPGTGFPLSLRKWYQERDVFVASLPEEDIVLLPSRGREEPCLTEWRDAIKVFPDSGGRVSPVLITSSVLKKVPKKKLVHEGRFVLGWGDGVDQKVPPLSDHETGILVDNITVVVPDPKCRGLELRLKHDNYGVLAGFQYGTLYFLSNTMLKKNLANSLVVVYGTTKKEARWRARELARRVNGVFVDSIGWGVKPNSPIEEKVDLSSYMEEGYDEYLDFQ